jgi:tetratricopeptide (TPR) repeat protein
MREGLGTAAKTVMEITSFLFPDDIPKELINVGCPVFEDEDINDTLQDEVGLKQVLEILTIFSLFQSTRGDSLSIHRLVQEVVRDSIKNEDKHIILLNAIRMVNFALASITSPSDALQDRNKQCIKRGSLYMWSKVATNAIVLKGHLVTLANEIKRKKSCFFNVETIKVLQTTAVFHSLHQRQYKALANQQQMIRIITTVDVSETEYEELKAITIPLLQQDRLIIQNSIASVMTDENDTDDQQISHVPLEPEVLNSKGNEAFQKCKFHDAIQYYTEGIRACSEGDIVYKLLSNRSELYIRNGEYEKALADANKCIKLASDHWKAYRSKAYAIAGLIDNGSLPSTMESVGLASASIATYMDKTCLLEFKMKITYPVINYKIVEKPERLGYDIMSMTDRPFITLMLRKGRYTFSKTVITTKSVQLIGIEDGVEINTGIAFCVCRPPKQILAVDIEIEQTIHVHFENIFFVSERCQIQIQSNSIATFYQCKFSNGNKACDEFPKCKGDKGCINPPKCKLSVKKAESYPLGNHGTVEPGYPGIAASNGGIVYLESCILDRCGGGGVVSDGEGSLIEMNNCTVRHMRQMGIEARNEGAIKAMNCLIVENQFHGVAIGPQCIGYISGNTIEGNGQEGIWCGGIGATFRMNSKGGSKSVIVDNVISHNGVSGLSFDGGTYEVKSNKIFENWLWGLMVKSKSSTYSLNNDIFENKCGGIRVGINYSASVLIDGNTIRDHTGLGAYAITFAKQSTKEYSEFMHSISEDETQEYSRRPIITSSNVTRNNDKGVQHPRNLINVIKTCCCCRDFSNSLKLCGNCKKATYFSKECQYKHWKRHRHLCKLLRETYTVDIQMKDTVPFMDVGPNMVGIRVRFKSGRNTGRPSSGQDEFETFYS